ncbi:hypothetical protein SELMODRAFT_415967 [Selaginella moellendorffii]|uniref:ATPase AAA-type core domain-containing protein n=1 Tax=Selaginella moellendorffii TaxID=88036 RepID=D8RXN6_SELML|nr:hypothetical protein SELMODRAFT_415967 [Selaginella moellendorffii]
MIAKAAVCQGPELLGKYLQDSEEHSLGLCVICLDEEDSLCSKRGTDRVVNRFLVEMDGLRQWSFHCGHASLFIGKRYSDMVAKPSWTKESLLTLKRLLAAGVDLAKLAKSAQLEGLSGSHLSELRHFETAREKLGKRLARVASVDNNRRCSNA